MATGLENLKVYLLAEELELEIFEITKKFPKDEYYRSVDQLRRSSSAVTNNIAEAYSRHYYKAKIRSYYIAKAEAQETKMNIIRCGKKRILDFSLSIAIANKYTLLLRLISGYINFIKKELSIYEK